MLALKPQYLDLADRLKNDSNSCISGKVKINGFSFFQLQDLHVFAFESDTFEANTGQRMYHVASYPVFWHYYRLKDFFFFPVAKRIGF